MNNTLMRIEFDNIVVKINNLLVAEQIKSLVIGKKPKTKTKRDWTEDEIDILVRGFANGETKEEISRSMGGVHPATSVYAKGFAMGLVGRKHKEDTSKPIEEFTI